MRLELSRITYPSAFMVPWYTRLFGILSELITEQWTFQASAYVNCNTIHKYVLLQSHSFFTPFVLEEGEAFTPAKRMNMARVLSEYVTIGPKVQ
jgi:hypothetical protein